MSIYKSKTGIIDSCESLICMDGIAAITNNDGIEELYLFRDALAAVGATKKLAVIEEAIALYESIHGRMPSQDEAEEIGDESSAELTDLDDKFYGCSEDLDALCIEYSKTHPEEIALLEEDQGSSQSAAKVLAALNA